MHGRTGLDGVELAEPKMQLCSINAVDFIVQVIMTSEINEITICALGPLTNLASAITKEPRIREKIKEIVMMGGGFFEGGNITPVAEFNIFVDPEAASLVLNSGIKIVMMPLDVTHKVLASKAFTQKIMALGSRTGVAVAVLLNFFGRYD